MRPAAPGCQQVITYHTPISYFTKRNRFFSSKLFKQLYGKTYNLVGEPDDDDDDDLQSSDNVDDAHLHNAVCIS